MNDIFVNSSNSDSDFPMGVTKIFPTIILQIGYILVHIGCIPTNDVNTIVIQHLLGIALSSMSFLTLGFPVAYGEDNKGIMGTGTWIFKEGADLERALIGWSAVSTSCSIIETVIAGRVHTISNIVITLFLSGFLQPLIVHWTWVEDGWMEASRSFARPFIDYGGSAVIHAFAGGFCLGVTLILGKRFITITDVDDNSLAFNSHSTTTVGYTFILLGLIGNIYSHTLNPTLFLLNCLIAIGMGNLIATMFNCIEKNEYDYWFAVWMLQGAMAAIVTVSAGINMYSIEMTMLASFFGTISYYITSKTIQYLGLSDNCNIIAIHLMCGLTGCLLLPFPLPKIKLSLTNALSQFGWQLLCSTVISLTSFISSLILLVILQCLGILRNRDEQQFYDEALKNTNSFLRTCLCCTLNQPPRRLQPGLHTIVKINKINKPIFKNHFKHHNLPQQPTVETVNTRDNNYSNKYFEEQNFKNTQTLTNNKVTILPPRDIND